MYPIPSRLGLGAIVFLEMHFIVSLNQGFTDFKFGIQEVICAFTVFSFLCWLRIADDFKDYELDCRLFAHRPLPSGRVTKKDLKICLAFFTVLVIILNIVFMHDQNLLFFFILYFYGFLMSKWFFQKSKIKDEFFF